MCTVLVLPPLYGAVVGQVYLFDDTREVLQSNASLAPMVVYTGSGQ